MHATSRPSFSSLARQSLVDGLVAGALSTVALLWGGRRDNFSAAAPLNAISHWIWPRQALRRNDATVKHTASGVLIHFASSMLWASVFRALRCGRRHATPANAVLDAAAVTSVAALVDLRVVPPRLTPGFEQRLQTDSLRWVYLSFAAGLALSSLLAEKRRGPNVG